ncbi:MAG: hydrogenase formation protein HypD, partial [Bacillota bacterium]|nr:hydrogenase formation protein HypD [Bacillota bacterium]
GFETTLPVYALLIKRAYEENLGNIRVLLSVKSLLPALYWICENGPGIDGFIGPGHVSTIIGSGAYEPLCRKSGIPLAVSGFGYEQIIAAVYDLLVQNKKKTCFVHNLYPNAVAYGGNTAAMSVISEYFVKKPSFWRGIGEIMDSGYFLSEKYKQFDGGSEIGAGETKNSACLCGSVIIGRARPTDCVFFGKACTPENPLGPCMVSSEGTCGIWHANM